MYEKLALLEYEILSGDSYEWKNDNTYRSEVCQATDMVWSNWHKKGHRLSCQHWTEDKWDSREVVDHGVEAGYRPTDGTEVGQSENGKENL